MMIDDVEDYLRVNLHWKLDGQSSDELSLELWNLVHNQLKDHMRFHINQTRTQLLKELLNEFHDG